MKQKTKTRKELERKDTIPIWIYITIFFLMGGFIYQSIQVQNLQEENEMLKENCQKSWSFNFTCQLTNQTKIDYYVKTTDYELYKELQEEAYKEDVNSNCEVIK